MGKILRFRRHARIFAGSRAASSVSRAAVRPADFADLLLKTDAHHSEGMRSRCAHLATAATPAPMSDAIASCDGQSEITDRKESIFVIGESVGRNVLNFKATMSPDCGHVMDDTLPMAKDLTATAFTDAFQARVKAAREARGLTQDKLASGLGVDQGTYKQWETRPGSLLPHEHVAAFCLICGVDFEWLFTARGLGPALRLPKKAPRAKAIAAPSRSKTSKSG